MTTLSLTGAVFNVRVRRGASFGPRTVTARYKSSGLPINLTGCTVSCQVRETADSVSVAATVTCTVLDAAAGTVSIELSDTNTALLPPADYKWDAIMVDAGGETNPWWRGTFTITERVTR